MVPKRTALVPEARVDQHAAESYRIGAGIDREKQALIAQIFVELLAATATPGSRRRNRGSSGVHREYFVHVAEIERDAATRRVDLALQRGAGPERNDRHAFRPRTAGPPVARRRCFAETPPHRAADWRSRWWYERAVRAPPWGRHHPVAELRGELPDHFVGRLAPLRRSLCRFNQCHRCSTVRQPAGARAP